MPVEARFFKVTIEVEFDLGLVEGPDPYTKAVEQSVALIEPVQGAKIKTVIIKEHDKVEGGGG